LGGDDRSAGSGALEKNTSAEFTLGFRRAASHLSPLSTPITRWVLKIIRKKHATRDALESRRVVLIAAPLS
jgi:hypothetical protein